MVVEGVSPMDLEMHVNGDGILTISGELDMRTAVSLVDRGTAALERSDGLTLDLSGLQFIDSSGIRAFLALAERATGALVLSHPGENVRKVIELTGIVGRHGITLEE